MVPSGQAKGCTLTHLSSEKSIQWVTTNSSGNCTFPGTDNSSTYKLSCLRAPPAWLQKTKFSGRRGWGQIITFNMKVQIWRAYFWKDKSTHLTVSRSTEHVILSHPDRVELRRPAMKHVWITASSFFEYLIRSFYILQSIAIRYNLVGKH